MSRYTTGQCKGCKAHNVPLKDGYCIKCNNKAELPPEFRDIFKGL